MSILGAVVYSNYQVVAWVADLGSARSTPLLVKHKTRRDTWTLLMWRVVPTPGPLTQSGWQTMTILPDGDGSQLMVSSMSAYSEVENLARIVSSTTNRSDAPVVSPAPGILVPTGGDHWGTIFRRWGVARRTSAWIREYGDSVERAGS